MILRRKKWYYLAAGEITARRIAFNKPVTKNEATELIIKLRKHLPIEMWPIKI